MVGIGSEITHRKKGKWISAKGAQENVHRRLRLTDANDCP